jgi:hypothetical protein
MRRTTRPIFAGPPLGGCPRRSGSRPGWGWSGSRQTVTPPAAKRRRTVGTGWNHTRVARSNPKTAADKLFEAYLTDHGVRFEYEPDWAAAFGIAVEVTPDFLVDPADTRVVCEVKQFESTRVTDRLLRSPRQAAYIPPTDEFGPIRSKVREAAVEQLCPFKTLAVPLVVVLANPLRSDVGLGFYEVAHALLGNPKVRIPVGPEGPTGAPVTEIAEDYGALISVQPDGTTINRYPFVSAVVVVHQSRPTQVVSEDSDRWVHVYDVSGNPTPPGFSGTPLPRGVFLNGPRDRRYGFADESFRRIAPPADGWL